MILNFEERNSALWLKIRNHIERRIDLLRRKNDGMLDEMTTASIRGEIRALKELVALEEDPPSVTDD